MLRVTRRKFFFLVFTSAALVWYVLQRTVRDAYVVSSETVLPRSLPPISVPATVLLTTVATTLTPPIPSRIMEGLMLPFNAQIVFEKASTMAVTETLLTQLTIYMKRVEARRVGKYAKLYAGMMTVNVSGCPATTPECAIFQRLDVVKSESLLPKGFMYRKCCDEHRALKTALEVYMTLMASVGVKSWATAGTLLGMVRERGTIIPWDTDIDVLIRRSDLETVKKVLESAPVRVSFIDKVDHGHGHLLAYVYSTPKVPDVDAPHVEIWVAQENKKMQRANVTFPLVECAMYDLPMYCPGRYMDVLLAGYGPNWSTPCKAKSSNCKT